MGERMDFPGVYETGRTLRDAEPDIRRIALVVSQIRFGEGEAGEAYHGYGQAIRNGFDHVEGSFSRWAEASRTFGDAVRDSANATRATDQSFGKNLAGIQTGK